MERTPKIVQCDKRGQIVIPKDIRTELSVSKKTEFNIFSVTGEGLLLKIVKKK